MRGFEDGFRGRNAVGAGSENDGARADVLCVQGLVAEGVCDRAGDAGGEYERGERVCRVMELVHSSHKIALYILILAAILELSNHDPFGLRRQDSRLSSQKW